MFSRSELCNDFRALGLVPGDLVMLHASVRSVGPRAGGPDQIHLALLDAISPGGTIMMYAGCPRGYDEVGRGRLSPEDEREIIEKFPAFDPLLDRADRENGTLVEFLRSYPGTMASSHVARMIARGARAEWLISETPQQYGYGLGSPMDRFQQANGKIVLLGSDHDQVTFLHYVEHVTDFPGKKIARYKVPFNVAGERQWLEIEEVNTAGDGAHTHWPDRFFAQIVDGFIADKRENMGLVGNSETYVLNSQELLNYAASIMRTVAK
jgi:aminoglycoside 3-N-acetyltransferase